MLLQRGVAVFILVNLSLDDLLLLSGAVSGRGSGAEVIDHGASVDCGLRRRGQVLLFQHWQDLRWWWVWRRRSSRGGRRLDLRLLLLLLLSVAAAD